MARVWVGFGESLTYTLKWKNASWFSLCTCFHRVGPKGSVEYGFMNHRAPANGRYKPTCYEHAANCYTHAFLIVPAIVGSALLHRLSDDCWEKITAWIYGMGLCALFIVSTVFHIVSWKKSHLRTVEHCFHMCDRMVIYFFIAASYAPWLNLRELGPLASHMRWFIWLMAAGGTIYVFLYHEKLPNVKQTHKPILPQVPDKVTSWWTLEYKAWRMRCIRWLSSFSISQWGFLQLWW
ncbi:monocyte to macrophage differentiation factor isoform X4 [Prionailurus bengalensis]|uniref:monocyte to macrophage differentiation factor isoform X4 n=1 Tax=Prionailurus bengalensis TaxID=37029 RepID=UPI001CA961A0|nr:monocyte to macrophage differentiation factor isoform X4 [Prionailurus bengalensis]